MLFFLQIFKKRQKIINSFFLLIVYNLWIIKIQTTGFCKQEFDGRVFISLETGQEVCIVYLKQMNFFIQENLWRKLIERHRKKWLEISVFPNDRRIWRQICGR